MKKFLWYFWVPIHLNIRNQDGLWAKQVAIVNTLPKYEGR